MDPLSLVDEETRGFVEAMAQADAPDYDNLAPQQARAAMEDAPKPPAAAVVRELNLAQGDGRLPALLYGPPTGSPRSGLLLYLHGGGFVLGDAAGTASVCRRIAHDARCHVLSLDYSLAPEARFPVAVHECLRALDWGVEHAGKFGWDARRISVGGESAGGNLAAVSAQQWVGAGRPELRLQVLICPLLDFRSTAYPSRRQLSHDAILSTEALEWFETHYLHDSDDRADPRISPIALRSLAGVPRAHVVSAALDPLRDEAECYAGRLAAAGVPVWSRRYPSIHAFVGLHQRLSQGQLALGRIAESVGAAMQAP